MRSWARSLQIRRRLRGEKSLNSNPATHSLTSKFKLNGFAYAKPPVSVPVLRHARYNALKRLGPYNVGQHNARLTTVRFNTSVATKQDADPDVVEDVHLLMPASLKEGAHEHGSRGDASVDPFKLRRVRCADDHGEVFVGLVIELGHMLNPSTLSSQIKFFLETCSEPALLFDCGNVQVEAQVKQWATRLHLDYKTLHLLDAHYRPLAALFKSSVGINIMHHLPTLSVVKYGSYLGQLCQDIIKTPDIAQRLAGPQLGELWGNHWHILMLACKGLVDALPDLELQPSVDPIDLMHGHQTCASYNFTIRNNRFDISISKSGMIVSELDGVRAYLDAVMQYCKAIAQALESGFPHRPLTFGPDAIRPTEILQRIAKALDLGEFRFDTTAQTSSIAWPSENVYSSRVHFGRLQDELPSVTWPNTKHVQAMAAMQAVAYLKPRVEQALKDADISASRNPDIARASLLLEHQTRLLHSHDPPTGKDRVFEVPLHDRVLRTMSETLGDLMSRSFPTRFEWESLGSSRKILYHRPRSWSRVPSVDAALQKDLIARRSSPEFQRILQQQKMLPLRRDAFSNRIIRAIENHDVVLITAATGSGKTTQISQMIYDHAITNGKASLCNIACTQPRRIATTSVAHRVAAERLQPLGKEIGYRVRFDDLSPQSPNAITFFTSGMLLRLIERDPEYYLSQYSHFILDEVHVRDMDSDLLLTILSNNLSAPVSQTNPRPKIILMSATISSAWLVDYIRNADVSAKFVHIEVPGTMYPVEEKFLDDVIVDLDLRHSSMTQILAQDADTKGYLALQKQIVSHKVELHETSDISNAQGSGVQWFRLEKMSIMLVVACVADILRTTSNGDILVFLPGLGEIDAVARELLENHVPGMSVGSNSDFQIFKLHSSLRDTNYDVFKPIQPGCRRVVLATNIAETSLTIPDVVHVIDSGLSRQSVHNQVEESARFGLTWISKAEARQRRGRCGRTSAGQYTALFSQGQYEAMHDEPYPEILRTDLGSLILRLQDSDAYELPQVKRVALEAADGVNNKAALLLRTTLSPPRAWDVEAATQQLRRLRALHDDNKVTALGRAMSALPTEPSKSKPVLLGLLFKCLDPLLIAAARADDLPIVHAPLQKAAADEVRREYSAEQDSDVLADVKVFLDYSKVAELGDKWRMTRLERTKFVRRATVKEMTRIVRQIADEVHPFYDPEAGRGDISEKAGGRNAGPAATPAGLNKNSLNDALVKALLFSTAGTRTARWRNRNWFTAQHPRVLPRPGSVNYMRNAKDRRRAVARREDGDMCAYRTLRITPDVKFPWIEEVSIVSPLTAMLFGESMSVEGDTIVVNDYVRYQIRHSNVGSMKAAKIIFEYRKALDRFLGLAFCSIKHHVDKTQGEGNEYLSNLEHPFRKVFVDSIVKILEIDTRERRERAQDRSQADELGAKSWSKGSSKDQALILLEEDEKMDHQAQLDDLGDEEDEED